MNNNVKRDRDFTSLEAWKKAREVKLFFYQKILPKLPPEEKFNLNTQIRKAAVSGTANIAEGYGRYHYKEGVQFYRISRGSLFELKDHLLSCFDLSYIKKICSMRAFRLLIRRENCSTVTSITHLIKLKPEKKSSSESIRVVLRRISQFPNTPVIRLKLYAKQSRGRRQL